MKRRDKADRVGEILDELYPEPPIPLDHVDPFTLLVSVMLSAQTTDKKVNEVTPALFAEASDPKAMAAMPVERILEHIRTVGLAPTKAKNLKKRLSSYFGEHTHLPAKTRALVGLPRWANPAGGLRISYTKKLIRLPTVMRASSRRAVRKGKDAGRKAPDLRANPRGSVDRVW